jgi:hypothetical protein
MAYRLYYPVNQSGKQFSATFDWNIEDEHFIESKLDSVQPIKKLLVVQV